MAQQEVNDDEGGLGGLGAVRMAMMGQRMPGADQIEDLASKPILPPENKWLKFSAAMLKPTAGGRVSDEMSNGIGAYAGAQDAEAELRAKYAPIIASALLQRQQLGIQQQVSMYKLGGEWDSSLTGALTGLMSNPDGVNYESAVKALNAQVSSGRVPLQVARQYAAQLPKDPAELFKFIKSKTVSNQSADSRLGAVTPKIELSNNGGAITPTNINPNAGPTPVGPVASPIPNTLAPAEQLVTTVDTAHGPFVFSKLTGKSAPVGSPEAQAIVSEAKAAQMAQATARPPTPPAVPPAAGLPPGGPGSAPPGVPPGAPPQGMPPQGSPGAPPQSPPPGPPQPAPSVVATMDPADRTAATAGGEKFAAYEAGLNGEVQSLRGLTARVQEMRDATTKFRSGATGATRLKIGAFAKDLSQSLGVSDAQSAALGNRIAGGDISAMQEFQKLAVQGAMESLKAAAGTGQRFTQAEYAQFLKSNPNLDIDPGAMEKINNFVNDQYRKASAEQNFLVTKRAAGVPVLDIQNMWNQQSQKLGYNVPTSSVGRAVGTTGGPPTTAPMGTDINGKKMHQENGVWFYD